MDKIRRRLKPEEAILIGKKPKAKEGNRNPRYWLTEDEIHKIKEFRFSGVEETASNLDIDHENLKHYWKKTKSESGFITNPNYKQPLEKDFEQLEQQILKTLSKHIKGEVKKEKVDPVKIETSYLFDMLVFTDVHIGMNPNPNGFSLYGGKWNEKEINKRCKSLIKRTLTTKKSNTLLVYDLGDFVDGWNGQTVRKGHDLPQNMDNETAFDVALNFKIKLIEGLIDQYQEIKVVNICDDNHAGAFGYVVNSAFKLFIESKYDHVKVINQRKFIDHIIIENKCIVSTHGKDGQNLKFGFKPQLDAQQVQKIENYLLEHDLIKKGSEIFVIKGDSHQDIFDNSTSQHFSYWNIPALSPSSNWVQTNFKKGKSGFYNINFKKKGYTLNPHYFEWKN